MELTRKQAIDQSIEIWEEMVAQGGGDKERKIVVCAEKFGHYTSHCPLCQYACEYRGCVSCPYAIEFGVGCSSNGYLEWVEGSVDRLEWAKKFLGQLYYLKHFPPEGEDPKEEEEPEEEWVDVTEECELSLGGDGGEDGYYVKLTHKDTGLAFFGAKCNSIALHPYKIEIQTAPDSTYSSGSFTVLKLGG